MSEPVTQYLENLAKIMRKDAKAMLHETHIDTRDDFGIPIFLPADPADNRPELDALALMVRDGCRGVVDLDLADWRVIADELTFQIARHLAKHERIKLPNLGTLEIAFGEHGPLGRLTLAPEARP